MIENTTPKKLNNYNGYENKWSSIRQPYIFEFTRKDGTYNSFSTTGSGKLQLDSVTLNGYTPVVGETLTIVDDLTKRKVVATVVATPAGSIETDIDPPIFLITSGYFNWQRRENYKIILNISAYVPAVSFGGEIIQLGDCIGTPNGIGVTKIDIRQLLTYGCEKINKYSFDFGLLTSAKDWSGWIQFEVVVNDNYIFEGVESYTTRDEYVGKFWGIDGVKQLLSVYGQNYSDYVATSYYPSKFLTCFKRPVFFTGYPFALSLILPEEYAASYPILFVEEVYSNGGTSLQPSYFLNDTAPSVTLIALPTIATAGIDSMNVWIQPESRPVPSVVSTPFNYFIDNPEATYTNDVYQYAITEVKNVVIDNNCKNYPVYLMWKNSLGGWDFWLFDKVNETNISARQGDTFEQYIEDVEIANSREKIIQASGVKTLTVGDVVDVEFIQGLSEIERSPAVYILYNPSKLSGANPERAWLGVQLSPKGFKYRSNAQRANVEITIVFPDYYTGEN